METNTKMTIKEIITNNLFTNVFQPIYRLSNKKIVGYESLLRCQFVKSPELLFAYADEKGCKYNLDLASITNSVKDFAAYYKSINSYDLFLSVNVYPSTIAMPFFPQVLEQLVENVSLSNQQIILEINESERIKDLDKILKNICVLKEKGFLIALDDLGKGEYSLQALIEIEPHVIKLDRYFAKDLAKNSKKQKALSYIINFFSENTKIILEGIETEEDMRCARGLGVLYGQGYYLAEPQLLHRVD
jgi:EAL domain-containing protein (putative c-di-GMP-specific phosphodiesterase class I)